MTIIVSQLILIAVFRFWPEMEREPRTFPNFESEAIMVEEMIQTRQANAPASPPKPQVPVPVPTDEIIEEEILEFPDLKDFLNSREFSESLTTGQRGDEERVSGNPDRPPRVVRIVEPPMPEAAKREGIKAVIFVNFLVNSDGTVEEAYISEIRKYDASGENYEVVQDLGYGLLEASLEAAYQWKFRPASERGENVGAYTQNTFTFGF